MRGRFCTIIAAALGAWLGAAPGTVGVPTIPTAAAQGTLTPPAGQPRVTAPGGLRGRGLRRHRKFRMPRRHRH